MEWILKEVQEGILTTIFAAWKLDSHHQKMMKKNKTIHVVAEAFFKKATKLRIPVPEDVAALRFYSKEEDKPIFKEIADKKI